jgi:hypothetical protein
MDEKAQTDEVIKPLDPNTWEKNKTAQATRHRICNESKYFSINLPSEYMESMGYHTQCYRDFTAVPRTSLPATGNVDQKIHVLRSGVDHGHADTVGIFRKTCIFCNAMTKSLGKGRREPLGNCEQTKGAESIRNAAEALQDEVMMAKLGGIDLIAKEVRYHDTCRKSYLSQAKRQNNPSCKSIKMKGHELAFLQLKTHIDVHLIPIMVQSP